MSAVLRGTTAFRHSQVKLLVPSGAAGAVIGDRRGEKFSGFRSGPAHAWPAQKSHVSSMSRHCLYDNGVASSHIMPFSGIGVYGTYVPAPFVPAPFESSQEGGTPLQVLTGLKVPSQDVFFVRDPLIFKFRCFLGNWSTQLFAVGPVGKP